MPKPTQPTATRKRGGQPANANASKHNVYSKHFTGDEVGRFLEAAFQSDSLADEIGLSRILIDRITMQLSNATGDEFNSLAKLLLEATGRVGNLLRQQRVITGAAGDSLADAIASALDEIGEQLGIQT